MIRVERELSEDADDAVRIVSGLLRRGDHGEAFRERKTSVAWSASEAGLLHPAFSDERGTAIRIRRGADTLLLAREGDGPAALREVVRDASRRAGGSPFLKTRPKPAVSPLPPEAGEEERTAALAAALARALPDPRGISVALTIACVRTTRAVVTSRALVLCGTTSRLVASGVVRRAEATRPFAFQSLAPFGAAADALSRALADASRPVPASGPPAERVDAVLSPAAASVFWHEVVGHPLEAEGGERHSVLSRVPNAVVGPAGLFVTDDPTRPDLPGHFAFDDEGTPARAVPLVEDGRVTGLLTDRRTSGALSNGHARCSDYRRPPRARISNLVVPAGDVPPEALVERCGQGLFVREISSGSTDPESGRFLLVVEAASAIRRGRLGAPLARFALAGDALSALRHLDAGRSDVPAPTSGLGLCVKGGDPVPVGGVSPAILLRGLAVTGGGS